MILENYSTVLYKRSLPLPIISSKIPISLKIQPSSEPFASYRTKEILDFFDKEQLVDFHILSEENSQGNDNDEIYSFSEQLLNKKIKYRGMNMKTPHIYLH